MTARIDLLRHGETERGGGFRGSLDDALTPRGWQQMRDAVAGAGPWDVLVSSPLQRCAAFARDLAERSRLPLYLDADLRELHFGEWEGRSAAELMQVDADALGRFWADPYGYTPPGGEPLLHFEQRVLAALQRLQRRFARQRLLVVGHAGVMRLLLARQRGLPRERLLEVVVAHGELLPLRVSRPGAVGAAGCTS
ncbi:alpha-ribazole phosphatase family protein [Stutzerimonas stutzeri]|uniref:alpha-ribazole phosphatase family protein n=1 Tax=Stutzerimonas sp. S1 TaxID=3030652 RepID=UPI00222469AD|nr:alpha-ribazole phosphatase family protein [Stutzerimonas sp. S1]MCW3148447.1 alpha-ribazole phosphatase family protein [Stutzerimonas sp. S1]